VNRAIAFGCAAIPLGLLVWSLVALRRLFRLYAHREIFSQDALAALGTVALALCWYVLASFLAEAPITAALSLGVPSGHHGMSLSFKLEDITVLFVASVMRIFTQVTAQGRRVADENASFV
jgi:hypothetical protein